MVNDLLSDPCAYGQRTKSVDACLFCPNESPILRILGMNNRNKITFKMLHLTVDAWRLQRLHSFPQLTSHTCSRPAGFTQEARGLSIGRYMIRLTNMDFYSTSGPIHACASALRWPSCTAKTRWISTQTRSVWKDRVITRNTFPPSFRNRISFSV